MQRLMNVDTFFWLLKKFSRLRKAKQSERTFFYIPLDVGFKPPSEILSYANIFKSLRGKYTDFFNNKIFFHCLFNFFSKKTELIFSWF